MSFCDAIWEEMLPVREQILNLPFLTELAAGTLPADSFRHYIVQDSLYLAEYARILALAAARAPNPAARMEWSDGAKVALVVEESLHRSYFDMFGVDAEIAARTEPTPACLGYSSFLGHLAATRSYAELVAGILPCFWVYWEVGCAIKPKAVSPNPYSAWIDTYATPEFGGATERARALVDQAAAATTPGMRGAMAKAFRTATRYEWMFWDSAYHRKGWPV